MLQFAAHPPAGHMFTLIGGLVAFAAQFQGFEIGGEGSAGADYTYTSGFPLTPDQEIRNGGVGLLNARVAYIPPLAGKRWTLQFWGKNLTDKQYFSGAAEQNNRGGQTVAPAAPRARKD